MSADLHIHTTASDGRLNPAETFAAAAAAGLTHIAITDHDTLDGLRSLLADPPPGPGPRIIPGIEFSTDLPDCEVHILGYCFDLDHPELNRQIRLIANDRFDRAARMIDKLAGLGYPLDYRRVLEIAGDTSAVGRPHVAKALIERGYFPDQATAFDELIGHGKPGYIPHYKLTPAQTVALIKSAGGIAVLAHPGLVGDDVVVRDIIRLGITGLEAYYPEHDGKTTARYLSMAAEAGLLVTGGSDFHGLPGRFPETLGLFTVPASLAAALECSSRHQTAPERI